LVAWLDSWIAGWLKAG